MAARELRLQFEQWLRAVGAASTVADDLGLAVYEALANVAEHAYPPGHHDPVVRLHATLDGDGVRITVSDHGAWCPPDDVGYRGRGIAMMRYLAAHVDVEPGPQGTTVALHAPLATNSSGPG